MANTYAYKRLPPARVKDREGTAATDEVARFTAIAESWWDPTGEFRPLHRVNPVRLGFIRRLLLDRYGRDGTSVKPFAGIKLLDVGCGGGLLSEPLARMGFAVTAIDAGDRNIAVARLHAEQAGLEIDYRVAAPEDLEGEEYDVVVSMEVVEHVPDPAVFLAAATAPLAPGGAFFGATLNRTPKSYALAVVGAEYILRWLPRGTHNWRKFVKPSEFAAYLRAAGLEVRTVSGMTYLPFRDEWQESPDTEVNYMLYAVKG
jgi:2-polyprenyl-6-hydroxyphenyl methylase/3-demethylubiquinone-9 3-methyltransferase